MLGRRTDWERVGEGGGHTCKNSKDKGITFQTERADKFKFADRTEYRTDTDELFLFWFASLRHK